MQATIDNSNVKAVFERYSDDVRDKLLALRNAILEVASENPEIGTLEETLKWGQISYLPQKRNVGTTIRIDKTKQAGQYAMYVPCSTTLLDTYRSMFGDDFEYEGDRAILLNLADDLPVDTIKHCIELVLTYHLRK